MKGMVFTELLDMVEDSFGADMVDDIIDDAKLASGGAYTAVGTYDHGEIVELVVCLSKRTGIEVPDLLKTYGQHLFARFAAMHTQFFSDSSDSFSFLETVHGYIHVEVRKLYPDAELPHLDCVRVTPDKLVVSYKSKRPFADFAEGLLRGCMEYFNEVMSIERQDSLSHPGCEAIFKLGR
jgi:hypothetical protein